MNSHRLIYIYTVLVIAAISTSFLGCKPKTKSLIELDQDCSQITSPLFSSQDIVSHFTKHYQSMPVPASIILQIDYTVDSLKLSRINLPDIDSLALTQNQYVLDTSLAKLSYNLVLAHFQQNDSLYKKVQTLAIKAAERHAHLTLNPYWPRHIENLSNFSNSECEAWLQAYHAEKQCFENHLSETSLSRAQQFGALALHKLTMAPDPRIELDVMQRLIYIHHHNESLYHLAILLSDYFSEKARAVSYDSRYMALRYHHCFTLGMAGYNEQSIQEYDKLLLYLSEHPDIPHLAEYMERTIVGKIGVFDNQCNLNEMSAAFNSIQVENFQDSFRKCEFLIMHGTFLRYIGELEKSEKVQKQAIEIAKIDTNIANEMDALLELATLYRKITEFNLAKTQLDSVESILLVNNNLLKQYYFDLYLHYADLYVDMGKYQLAHEYAQKANIRATRREIPFEKAKSFLSLSKTFTGMGEDSLAITALENAFTIFQDHGLTKFSIETLLDLANIHNKFSDTKQAKRTLGLVQKLLKNSEEEWYKLEFRALLGEYEFNRGNLRLAISHMNNYIQLLNKFNDKLVKYDKIKGLNQRTFGTLQKAVLYEIQLGRNDSAFVKLEYAKARALQSKRNSNQSCFLDLEQLQKEMAPDELILSYLVSPDTLYTFAITYDSLKVFRKDINKNNLVTLSQNYLQTIHETINDIENLDLDQQFQKTVIDGSRLSSILFNNSKIKPLVEKAEITFIVPDDILYRIPFSCLPISSADTTEFLISKSAVVNLPSSFFYHRMSCELTEQYNEKHIVFSVDPRFPRAAQLTNFIKNNFSKAEELALDGEFSKEYVTEKLGTEASIYLFFGHSRPNLMFPDASTIDLCIKNTQNSSYHIEAFSIADLKKARWTSAETVYLIGCETGSGLLYKGSGLASIGESLLQMGIPEIITSFWKIDEKIAARQIQRFLSERINHKNSAVALRSAQLEQVNQLKKDSIFKQAHPSLWACLGIFQAY